MKKDGFVQLNAHIPTLMHTDLKKQAVDERRTMAAILQDAVRAYLKKKKK